MIEDNPHNLELMSYLLEASGHQVARAASGAEGIALAGESAPDLIVLDIHLPDMTGYDVLTQLRARLGDPQPLIIAVTANAMVGDRQQAIASGFDGYVSKPIEPRSFATTLDAFLREELRGHAPKPAWGNSASG